MSRVTLAAIALALSVAPASAQTGANQTLTNPTPSDARMNQFDDPKGTTWKVLALDSDSDGPLGIVEVQEIRQQNPPSTWAVFVQNRSYLPVTSYSVSAAIVDVFGAVKAIQPLPKIKNLKPAKVARQEMRVQTIMVPTDRVVFFIGEVSSETGQFVPDRGRLEQQIKAVVKRYPAP